jgi:hypothetical protein
MGDLFERHSSLGLGPIPYLEKKYGYAPYKEESDWKGKFSKGWEGYNEKRKDKDIKEKIEKTIQNLKFQCEECRIKNCNIKQKLNENLYQRLWLLYKSSKQNKKKLITLIGSSLETTTKGMTLFFLERIYTSTILLIKKYSLDNQYYEYCMNLSNILNCITKKIEILKKDNEAQNKANYIYSRIIENVKGKQIKFARISLSRIDNKFDKVFSQDFSALFKVRSSDVDFNKLKHEGLDLAHFLLEKMPFYFKIKVVKKPRDGFIGACCYFLAHNPLYPYHSFSPLKEKTKWSKFLGINRDTLTDRLKEIKSIISKTDSVIQFFSPEFV